MAEEAGEPERNTPRQGHPGGINLALKLEPNALQPEVKSVSLFTLHIHAQA